MANERFRADAALAPLKVFQRRTVDYVFDRLYGDDDPVSQFLVADEVGLGKTMVARGVIARMIEHLWDSTERICQSASNRDPVSASKIDPLGAELARRCVVLM
ncbi:hypothetical protein OEZ60_14745 [Defluviimonas sp. WL0024]|uniref:SNF2 family N-terminal domain-containing protein n=1 Tax=Albidovulum salinarum TaxID=2984153 RepID=A0ABT2X6A4_9RHOB|nr:hypothetical protein [Defluviimonas sp. WL0024]MCU9849259.1 hypothetical protein [Defluviimonas sp. WL0024]